MTLSKLHMTALAAALLIELGACAMSPAAPSTAPIATDPDHAFLVVASHGLSLFSSVTVLRRVDLEAGQFKDELVEVRASLWAGGRLDAGDLNKPALFAKYMAPGDYAIVEWRSSDGVWTKFVCFEESAPVVTLTAGQISIVRVDHLRPPYDVPWTAISDEALKQQFEEARIRHPLVKGQPVLDQPAAMIDWPKRDLPFALGQPTRRCAEPSTFRREQ